MKANELCLRESAFPVIDSEADCMTISYPVVRVHSAISENCPSFSE